MGSVFDSLMNPDIVPFLKDTEAISKAIVREPGDNYSRCISSHPLRRTIDLGLAREQHRKYAGVLEDLGIDVIKLDRDDQRPDSCFVEDNAVVQNGKALICRAARESRRGEEAAIEEILVTYMPARRACEPATIEGGDVLHLPDRLISGITQRTNREGTLQLSEWLDVKVDLVEDPHITHLKSYVSYLGNGRAICTMAFSSHPTLKDLDLLVAPSGEEYAANVLVVGDAAIIPAGFPRTREILRGAGMQVTVLDMSEFPKCEGAMTCLSVLF